VPLHPRDRTRRIGRARRAPPRRCRRTAGANHVTGPALLDVVDRAHIVVCAGTGGVGKTTTAAALALVAARRGRSAAVVTIDPARRLADALGAETLTNEPHEIPCAGADGGSLHALMLDT